MTGAFYYALTAVVSALAFAVGRRIGRAGRRRAIAGYAVLLALLLTKAVLNHRPDWEFALFPWSDYIYFQSYAGYPIGLVCLGMAMELLPDRRNRRAVAVLAGFVFAVSLWTERWIVIEPDDSSGRIATADHHCLQSTIYSCGPAACVSLLSYWDVEATEGEMMRRCRTPPYGGTSLFRICRGLRSRLGDRYDVRIVDGDPERLRGLDVPAIVSVRRVHVVTVKFCGDEVVVQDPARGGPRRVSFAAYRSAYAGYAVVATRRD